MFKNVILKNTIWLLLSALALAVMKPGNSEINTISLIIIVETLALALTGIAHFSFSKIIMDSRTQSRSIGYIFLGVHLCVGLVVVGVYIPQL